MDSKILNPKSIFTEFCNVSYPRRVATNDYIHFIQKHSNIAHDSASTTISACSSRVAVDTKLLNFKPKFHFCKLNRVIFLSNVVNSVEAIGKISSTVPDRQTLYA